MRRAAAVLLALLALLALAPPLRAQEREVTVRGDDRSRAVQLARALVARGGYVLIDQDTTLPAYFRAPAGLVVVDAEVRLEGVVDGGVAVLGGHLYLRPRSRVGGPIAVVDGGVYPSALAEYEEIFESRISTDVDVLPVPGGPPPGADWLAVTIDPPPYPARITLVPRPFPSYDRVNGATLSAGLRLRLTRAYDDPPTVDAWVSYRTGREDFGGGVVADVPLDASVHLVGEVSRASRTNDAWIRGDLFNSVSALAVGADYRDYYESDLARLLVERQPAQALLAGESWIGPRLGVLVSRDRSLAALEEPWALTGRDELRRPNPGIEDGTVVSAVAGAAVQSAGRSSFFTGDLVVERGLEGAGDFGFTQLVGEGRWETTAFQTHELWVYFRGMGTLGDDAAPRQRDGILGGAGTLPTLEIGELRGDRLFFVSSSYSAPVPYVEVPFLGQPYLELTHATGTAWATGTPMPRWVQNVGAGLRSGLVRGLVVIDPEEPGDPAFVVELVIPGLR